MKLVAVLILGMSMVACGGGTGVAQIVPVGGACATGGGVTTLPDCPEPGELCECVTSSICVETPQYTWICVLPPREVP
jgi:hypothetical protein